MNLGYTFLGRRQLNLLAVHMSIWHALRAAPRLVGRFGHDGSKCASPRRPRKAVATRRGSARREKRRRGRCCRGAAVEAPRPPVSNPRRGCDRAWLPSQALRRKTAGCATLETHRDARPTRVRRLTPSGYLQPRKEEAAAPRHARRRGRTGPGLGLSWHARRRRARCRPRKRREAPPRRREGRAKVRADAYSTGRTRRPPRRRPLLWLPTVRAGERARGPRPAPRRPRRPSRTTETPEDGTTARHRCPTTLRRVDAARRAEQ